MHIFSNPFIWLRRVRHRCGYGVHSPFAFRFLTDVVYEREAYYAYRELDAMLSARWRFRRRKGLHLLFRLTNYVQPSTITVPADCSQVRRYVQAACPHAVLEETFSVGETDLCILLAPDDVAARMKQGGVLVLNQLHHHRDWFRNLPATVLFDLYDVGIAFYDEQYYRQYYIINF